LTSSVFGLLALTVLPAGGPPTGPSAEVARPPRRLPADRAFLRFLAASALGAVVYRQATSTFPLQVHADGHAATVYGALLGSSAAMLIVGELPLTGLTRRWRPQLPMAAGLLLIGLGLAVNAAARAVLPLTAGVLGWTLGAMLVFPIAEGYWAAYAPANHRGRYAGGYSVAWAVGNILAPAVGGVIFARSPTVLWLSCGAVGAGAAVLLLRSAPTSNPDP